MLVKRTTLQTLALAAVVSLVLLFAEGRQTFVSAEVSFTDLSLSGLAIVPASCPSPPPEVTSDLGGYKLYAQDSAREISNWNQFYCLTDAEALGSPAYFIPMKTEAELDAFTNAIPRFNLGKQDAIFYH